MNDINSIQMLHLSKIYSLLGGESRLRMLLHLRDGEMTASELATSADLSPSAASHQLKKLKEMKVVKMRKQGKEIYYALDDYHIELLLKSGVEHVTGKGHDHKKETDHE